MHDPFYDTIRLDRPAEHVLRVTLARPAVRNAINTDMGLELERAFRDLQRDPTDVRVVILTGDGDLAFCAGADLKERRGMDDEAWARQHRIFESMVRALLALRMPTIAAIRGAAYGGGAELAMACDLIVAADDARFALTETRLGILPGLGGIQHLARAIGPRRAKELLLTAMPFSASDAHAWGLVNRVVAPNVLAAAAQDLAGRIAENAPLAVRRAKRLVDLGASLDRAAAMDLELEVYHRLVGTEDRREGVLAFHEKRDPHFVGR